MKKVVLALALCFGFVGGTFAAVGDGSVHLLGGYAIPVGGDWGDGTIGFKGSFALAGGGDYQFHEMMAFGVEGGYNFKHEHQTITTWDVKMWYITPYLKGIHKMDNMTFYGIVGGGIYGFNSDATVFGTMTDPDDSTITFGFNMGGGILFVIAENVQAGIDVRWHHAFNVFIDDTDINNIVPSAIIAFFFGQ
jgi:hypothetical protein